MWAALSDERTDLLFTIAAGPRQRSHSWVRVQRDLEPYFTLSNSRLPPTWRARSPYLYPQGTRWPSYTPRHWLPFSSPHMTRRTTVEVFKPASTRGDWRPSCLITPRHGPSRNPRFQQYFYRCESICCCGNMVAYLAV
jgi:hypothetical protein